VPGLKGREEKIKSLRDDRNKFEGFSEVRRDWRMMKVEIAGGFLVAELL